MYPILLTWGAVVLPAWHTFYVLGALAAYLLLMRLGRLYASQIDRSDLARLYIACYVAGYFGARLLSVAIEEPDVHGPVATLAALARFGAMTFYGGAIAAFAAGALYTRLRRLPLPTIMDLGVPAGMAALAVGRIGCFLNGDDYGRPAPLGAGGTAPFWSATFPNLADGVPRVPVQLLEALLVGLTVYALCRWFVRLRLAFRPGVIGFFGIIGYANLRFLLEFLRDDFRGFAFGTWLSTSQFISLMVLAACGLSTPLWVRRRQAVAGNL